jgi:hypothetical protein
VGQVRDDDLTLFAADDGLLARIAERPSGSSNEERQYMLDRARENLARVVDISLEDAGKALHQATLRGELTEQYSEQFAVVSLQGRILYVLARTALRGVCHPEQN